MSNYSVIDENLLETHRQIRKYRPYETQSRENLIFRIFPDFIFRIRWVLQSFLHKKLFRAWRIDVTIGGLYFFTLVIAVIAMAEYLIRNGDPEARGTYTGRLSFLNLCMVFSFASRNSLWAWLVGLSLERAIIWHKFFAFTLIVCSFIHGLTNQWVSFEGLLLFISFIVIFVLSLWFLRRSLFYYFYLLHIILICVIFYNAYQHNPEKNLIACSFWLVDIALRGLFQLYFLFRGATFNIRISKNSRFIELSSQANIINHRPGQFFFLTIPRLSLLEPHTFTAATTTEEQKLTFYIRSIGDWTAQLAKLAQKQASLAVLLNGPYGIPTVDIESTSAKHFVLVAGGIGITFLRPYAHWLLDQVRRGRKLSSVTLLWALREAEMLEFIQLSDLLVETAIEHKGRSNSVSQREDFVFDLKVFLKCDLESFVNVRTPVKNCLRRESLDMDAFFRTLEMRVTKKKRHTVKVLCCGPERMVRHCFKLAKKHGYDIHSEYFEF